MATTGIWKIEKRLDNVLNYTTNAEKTMSDESYRELHNVIEYIESDYKTEEQFICQETINDHTNSLKHYVLNIVKIPLQT